MKTETTISKWGNSKGIRLPKTILNELNLQENDKVTIEIEDNRIVIEKIENEPKTLKERLETFYNKPIDEIYVESTDTDLIVKLVE